MATFRSHLRSALGAAALLTPLAAAPASAEPYSYSYPYPSSGSYSARLEDESGSPLRTFYKDGSTFVLGHSGARFAIRLSNHSGRRVEAVVSVDGRDAVSGRIGDYVRERGYVLPPYGSVVVEGFRQSLDQVAAFRFADPHESYSARMGTPENVGVIGVAFFPERQAPAPVTRRPYRFWERPLDDPRDDYRAQPAPYPSSPAEANKKSAPRSDAPSSASSRSRPSASMDGAYGGGRGAESAPSRLGTEYAESRQSHVTEVPFQRASQSSPATVIRLRYDDAEGLMARGIDVYPDRYWSYSPPAYPEAFPRNRFAPPPP